MIHWFLPFMVLSIIELVIAWIVLGRMPHSNVLVLGPKSTAKLPFSSPKLLDMFLAPLLVPVIYLVGVRSIKFERGDWRTYGDSELPFGLGIFFGLCGSLIAGGAGINWAVLGAIIVGVLSAAFEHEEDLAKLWQVNLMFGSGSLTMIGVITMFQGFISGLIVGLVVMTTGLTVIYGWKLTKYLFKKVKKPVVGYFSCPIENT